MQPLGRGLLLFGLTGLGWAALFHTTKKLLTSYLSARGKKLTEHHILNICEAAVCSVQALVSSVCGVVVVWSCSHNVMRAVHPLATEYAWVVASYFLYDLLAMYKVHLSSLSAVPGSAWGRLRGYLQRRTLLVLHHVVIAGVMAPIVIYRRGLGDFFVGCFYCVELSGPFTNMRVILSRLGLKQSKWYTVNGLCMIASFAVCRVLLFPYMYHAYGQQYSLSVTEVMHKIPLHCNLGCLVILLPQLYWLRLMILGAFKISRGQKLTEADEKID